MVADGIQHHHHEIVFVGQIYAVLELNRLLAIARQTHVFGDHDQMDLRLDSCKEFLRCIFTGLLKTGALSSGADFVI